MTTFPALYANKRRIPHDMVNGFLPRIVIVPLKQEYDYCCRCIVKKGEIVKEGEPIALPSAETEERLRSKIHSPVPGYVEEIFQSPTPDGKQERAVKIRLAGSFSYLGKKKQSEEWHTFSPSQIIDKLSEKGVINTFLISKPVSLAYDIVRTKKKNKRLLLVRLFDEEPGRSTDSLLNNIRSEDIKTGAYITAYALDAAGVVFLSDFQNNSQSFDQNYENFNIKSVSVFINTREYPCGFQKNIQDAVQKKIKGDPFASVDSDDLYVDASTMLSVCNAIEYGIPVVDQYVYISGDCIPARGLLNVCIGTTVRSLAEQCGGIIIMPAAIVINGLITGNTIGSLDTPITKYVKSVTLLSSRKIYDQRQSVCISCGNCRKTCPQNLSPDILYKHATGGKEADEFYIKSAQLCSSCGMCNSVCPARLPISQTVVMLKAKTCSR
jgi:Na+-translocating ferredoxin:NAD+ oxidoreductase subunit C